MVTPRKSDVQPTQGAALFEVDAVPPVSRQHRFHSRGGTDAGDLLEQPSLAHECIPALHMSSTAGSERGHHELRVGWAAMAPRDPMTGGLACLKPQQWVLADVLNAQHDDGRPLHRTTGVCVPRRASKTTTMLAVGVGRCLERPGYVVLFTAQSGTKARARFLDLARALDRINPNDYERGFRILRGAGAEMIEFANGSLFIVLPPKPDAFRGDAGDMIIVDEGQEHDADLSAELMGAIRPVMDTRPFAQLVIAGTAGKHRAGLLWDTLERGRAGGTVGILEFAAKPSTPMPVDDEPEAGSAGDPAVWLASHPGIGTLTTLDVIADNFAELPLEQFSREYLGIWPEDYSKSAIDAFSWRACLGTLDEHPRGEYFATSYDVSPDGTCAAVAIAWRDVVDGEPVACVEVLEATARPKSGKRGASWVAPMLRDLASRHRTTIGYDNMGAVAVVAEELQRSRPSPRLRQLSMRDVGAGCATFERELREHTLVQFDQAGLNEAALGVSKRPLGEHAWAWGRKASGSVDITPLIAATNALRTLDVAPAPQRARIIVSSKRSA